MCFLRPLRVKRIENKMVILDNGIKAIMDKKIGRIKKGDWVTVYGNLVLGKTDGPKN